MYNHRINPGRRDLRWEHLKRETMPTDQASSFSSKAIHFGHQLWSHGKGGEFSSQKSCLYILSVLGKSQFAARLLAFLKSL